MKFQRIINKSNSYISYTVLTDDYQVVEPAETYLSFISNVGRSPNTVRAYAIALASWFDFLEARNIAWDSDLMIRTLGEYTGSMIRGNHINNQGKVSRATANVALAAIYEFYKFHSHFGISVIDNITKPNGRRATQYKPLLQDLVVTKRKQNLICLPADQPLIKTLTIEQAVAIINAQTRLRNRFLFALLLLTGMRIGQALGLRHSDFISRKNTVQIVARDDNANGARAKKSYTGLLGESPITTDLVHLYSEYMHVEYGELDSDYVFVNLWSRPYGRPLTYNAVNDLIIRTRGLVGFHFTAHQFRHTFATVARKSGVPIDVLSRLLTHSSVVTTSQIYTHLDADYLRQQMFDAGVFERLTEKLNK